MTDCPNMSMYRKMIEAMIDYLNDMDHDEFTDRDYTILESLIEFYGFDKTLVNEILDEIDEAQKYMDKLELNDEQAN